MAPRPRLFRPAPGGIRHPCHCAGDGGQIRASQLGSRRPWRPERQGGSPSAKRIGASGRLRCEEPVICPPSTARGVLVGRTAVTKVNQRCNTGCGGFWPVILFLGCSPPHAQWRAPPDLCCAALLPHAPTFLFSLLRCRFAPTLSGGPFSISKTIIASFCLLFFLPVLRLISHPSCCHRVSCVLNLIRWPLFILAATASSSASQTKRSSLP